MLHWDIQKTQPLKLARPLGLKAQAKHAATKGLEPFKPNIVAKQPIQKTFPSVQNTIVYDDFIEEKFELQKPSEKTLVIFIAHLWTPDIESYYKIIKDSCKEHNLDLLILACGPRYECSEKIVRPSLEEIKNLYPDFHSKGLWACNHLLLLWLWNYWARDECYDKVWSIEYDVRSNGDLANLWNIDASYEYISTTPMNAYTTSNFWGPIKSGFKPTHTALKQVFRTSNTFLNYLHQQCLLGHTGQDECTLATHAQNFKHRNLLEYLCQGYGPNKNPRVDALWTSYKNLDNPSLKLFHPIK